LDWIVFLVEDFSAVSFFLWAWESFGERKVLMFPTDVVIVAGARTPMARYTGLFSEVSAIELGVLASKEAIRRSGVDPA
jgi:hypothetical protein